MAIVLCLRTGRLPQVGGFQGWAPGALLWDNPVTAGNLIGKGVGIVAISVNVHYTDGDIKPGAVAQDGIRMFYTPHLRNFTTVNTPIIFVGAGPADMVVPPKQERFFLTRKCTIEPLCEDTSDDLMRAATSRQYTCADLKDYCDLQSRIKAACPKVGLREGRLGSHIMGKLGVRLGGGVNRAPKTGLGGGGVGKRAQLTGPFVHLL